MSRFRPDAGAMSDLAQLITERKRELRWSFRKLAERSDDVITYGRWQQLAGGVRITEFPEPATLQAIAKGIDVDVTIVVLATAKSIGLDVRNTASTFATMLPSTVDDMDPDLRDALLRVIRLASRRADDASQEQGQKAGGAKLEEPPTIATLTDEERDRIIVEYMRANGIDIPDRINPATKRRKLRAVDSPSSEGDGRTTGDKRAGDGGRR